MTANVEQLTEQVLETIGELRSEKEETRQRYEQAQDSLTDLLEPQRGSPPEEFTADPYLLVASTPSDRGTRPLARRPDAVEVLDSMDVEFVGPNGPTDKIRPNTEYEIRATIRNLGGGDIPPSPIEFYVVPVISRSGVVFDGTDREIVLPPDPPHRITGWTADRPGNEVRIAIRRAGEAPALLEQVVETNADRTFTAEFDLSNLVSDGSIEVMGTIIVTTDSGQKFTSTRHVSGRFDTANVTTPQPLPLAVDTNAAEFLGHRRVRLLAESESTVSIPYTTGTEPFSSVFFRYSVIFVRAYSLSPPDMPDDLEVLDHRVNRQIGRKEVYHYD